MKNIIKINGYSYAFSDIDNTNYSIDKIKPIIKNRDKKCLVFSELHINNMSNEEISNFIKKAPELISFYEVEEISYFSFDKNKIPFFNIHYSFYRIINASCIIGSWFINTKVARNIRKAINSGLIIKNKNITYEEIFNVQNLAIYADYIKNDLDRRQLIRYCNYYFGNKDSVMVIAKYNDETIAGMLGIKIGDEAYMIQHNYNPKYNNLYVNDYLYFSYIKTCEKLNIRKIDFGNIELDDIGLKRMKEKYSTDLKDRVIIKYKKEEKNLD